MLLINHGSLFHGAWPVALESFLYEATTWNQFVISDLGTHIHARICACTPGKRGGVTCPEPQWIGGATSNLRFLNSSTSAFPIICTNTLSKGIRVNLVLRNRERVLTPPFPVIIRSPWGCHQSRAGWPASLVWSPRDQVSKGRCGWASGLGGVACLLTRIVQMTWPGWGGAGPSLGFLHEHLGLLFTHQLFLGILISTSGNWDGHNSSQE